MKTYVKYPPRKLQSMGYDGPLIELSRSAETVHSTSARCWPRTASTSRCRRATEAATDLGMRGRAPLTAKEEVRIDERRSSGQPANRARAGSTCPLGMCTVGTGARPAAVVARRRGQGSHRPVREEDHRRRQRAVRAAGRTRGHLRPGWHAVGRAADVRTGDVRLRPREGRRQGAAGAGQRAAVQGRGDGRPRGHGQVLRGRRDEDRRRLAGRADGRGVPGQP